MTMEVHEIPQWNSLRTARVCLGDWKQMLGKHYAIVRPLLVKCVGELAKSYPDPDTGLRLRVRECKGGYVAHPVGDFEADSRDYLLTEDDLQVWCVGLERGRKAESGEDISNHYCPV